MISLSMWVLVSISTGGNYVVSYSPPMATLAECEMFKTQVNQVFTETRRREFDGKCIPVKVAQKQ